MSRDWNAGALRVVAVWLSMIPGTWAVILVTVITAFTLSGIGLSMMDGLTPADLSPWMGPLTTAVAFAVFVVFLMMLYRMIWPYAEGGAALLVGGHEAPEVAVDHATLVLRPQSRVLRRITWRIFTPAIVVHAVLYAASMAAAWAIHLDVREVGLSAVGLALSALAPALLLSAVVFLAVQIDRTRRFRAPSLRISSAGLHITRTLRPPLQLAWHEVESIELAADGGVCIRADGRALHVGASRKEERTFIEEAADRASLDEPPVYDHELGSVRGAVPEGAR